MPAKLARIVIVLLANAALFYFASVTAVLIVSALIGLDLREPGLTMISPLAILIFGLIFPTVVFGIINGSLINVFWDHVTSCRGNLIKVSVILGGALSLLLTIWLAAPYATQPRSTGASPWPTLIAFPFVALVGSLTNFLTVVLVKPMFPNKELP